MSCRRAYEIDLAAFLADPRDPAHEGFRDHYPRCVDCSAEVRAWTEVEGLLRPAETHPEPTKLLALEDDRESLPSVERAALEAHVAECATCRDELAALRAFEPRAAVAEEARGAPARETAGVSSVGALLAAVRALLVQPAFAYALALLFAAPTLYRLVTSESDLLREAPLERAFDAREALEAESELQHVQRKLEAPSEPAAHPPEGKVALEPRDAPAGEEMEPTAKAANLDRTPAALRDEAAAEDEPTAKPRRSAVRPESTGLREGVAKQGAAATQPESTGISDPKLEQLRALGYVDAPSPEAPGAMRRAQAPAPAAEPVAEADTAESFAAADSLGSAEESAAVEAHKRAAPPVAPRGAVLEPAGAGLYRLRVPLEPDMQEVEVRVSPPGGGRMLSQVFRGAVGEVELEIPAAWVGPGVWLVERRALGRRDVLPLEIVPEPPPDS